MIRKTWLAACILAILTGCGSDGDQLAPAALVRDLGKRATTPSVAEQAAATERAVLAITPAQVAASTLPLARVRIEGTGAAATMAEVDRKGANSTWFTGDGGSFLFRDGMLTGTRGLGEDLMGLSGPGLAAAAKAGEATRIYRYLDGNERLVNVTLTCLVNRESHPPITILDRVHPVDQIGEYCRGREVDGTPLEIENFYWVSPGTTTVWQSRQFISWKFGRAEIEILKR